ncbi:MAG: SLC13 family permease [Alphaproteobacteria bacterium]
MSGRDTRTASQQIIGRKERVIGRSFIMILFAAILAVCAATLPALLGWGYFQELPNLARISIGIVVFAAFLWITEAIPAYAVSLAVIGLNVLLLSYTGYGGAAFKGMNIFGMSDILTDTGVQSGQALNFSQYLLPWANNLMWLFMAGFVLAEALTKTKLDLRFARIILNAVGSKPRNVLLGAMGATFFLSMFMSNTATAAMMIALMGSFVRTLPKGEPFAKALFLGVPVAANVGGVGTIIGTPPNGIAVEALNQAGVHIDFLTWMYIGVPVAFALFGLGFIAIWFLYKPTIDKFEMEFDDDKPLPDDATPEEIAVQRKKNIERIITLSVFSFTVFMWVTSKIHNISTYVIALIPIVLLGVTSIVDAKGFRKLPWDVLMLLTGGLSMGVAIEKTGLGLWMSGLVPDGVSPWATFIIVIILAIVMSNLLSHTVTASILIPITITMFPHDMLMAYIPAIALTTSCAMFLPISTPPNAVSFASGRIDTKDFMKIGGVMAVIGVIIAAGWGVIIGRILM